MEKKTMDTLRTMICGEIEEIAKKGTLSHETLDTLKDLVETEKNLAKIEKYEDEKKEKEYNKMNSYDSGYSQRKYYIDADYQPYSMRNNYDMNNSYGMSRAMYDMNQGNSYMYYDPRYEQMSGYARHGEKPEMLMELKRLMDETTDDKVRNALQQTITEVNK